MGALPKRKISKQRKNQRRSHDKLDSPTLGQCPECKAKTRAHHVCMRCGMYKGVQVVKV